MLTPVLILLALLALVNGDPCVDMSPGQGSALPQPVATLPYEISVKQTGSLYYVTLGEKMAHPVTTNGQTFKGFLLQARQVGSSQPLGSWTLNGDGTSKLVSCSTTATMLMHANDADKKSIMAVWKPPAVGTFVAGSKVVFIATVLKDSNTYWTNIKSMEYPIVTSSSVATVGSAPTANQPLQPQQQPPVPNRVIAGQLNNTTTNITDVSNNNIINNNNLSNNNNTISTTVKSVASNGIASDVGSPMGAAKSGNDTMNTQASTSGARGVYGVNMGVVVGLLWIGLLV